MSAESKKPKRGITMPQIILLIIGVFSVMLLLSSVIWTVKTNSKSENSVFLGGSLPAESLDGFYRGNAQSGSTWQGKRFEDKQGINIFDDGERYRFKFFEDTGLSNNQVIKLDYNQPGNPFWLKLIVDEVVQVKDGQYQGKVYVKLGPVAVPVTFFQLSRY